MTLTAVASMPLTLCDETSSTSEEVGVALAATFCAIPAVVALLAASANPASVCSCGVGRASADDAWASDGVTTGSAPADFCPSALTFVFVCCLFASAIIVDEILTAPALRLDSMSPVSSCGVCCTCSCGALALLHLPWPWPSMSFKVLPMFVEPSPAPGLCPSFLGPLAMSLSSRLMSGEPPWGTSAVTTYDMSVR
jgi:hypothetical protein